MPKPSDANRDRHVPLAGAPPAVDAWRCRMGRDDAREIYKERAATVELANAQTRNHGLRQFAVCGLEKVKTITVWFALAHNNLCGWRLSSNDADRSGKRLLRPNLGADSGDPLPPPDTKLRQISATTGTP